MALLKIIKLSTKTWKHNSDVDGDFILTKFYAKQEDNEFLLVETYGAKRRKYLISEIEVYDIGGTAETFSNFTDLFLRLEELKYPAFYVDGEFTFNPASYDLSEFANAETDKFVKESEVLSNDISTYTPATTPLSGTEKALIHDGTAFKEVAVSEFGGSGEQNIEVVTLQNRWTLTNVNTYYRSRGDYAGFNDAIMTITTGQSSYATLDQTQRSYASYFYYANGAKKLHKITVDCGNIAGTITSYTLMVVACQRIASTNTATSTINGINLGEYAMTKTSVQVSDFHILTPNDVTIPDGYIVTCFLKRADGTAEINCSIMFQFKNA